MNKFQKRALYEAIMHNKKNSYKKLNESINTYPEELDIEYDADYVVIEPNEYVLYYRSKEDLKYYAKTGDPAAYAALKLSVGESFYDSEVIYVRIK